MLRPSRFPSPRAAHCPDAARRAAGGGLLYLAHLSRVATPSESRPEMAFNGGACGRLGGHGDLTVLAAEAGRAPQGDIFLVSVVWHPLEQRQRDSVRAVSEIPLGRGGRG